MVMLNYRDARPIYSQIVDGLRQQITAGILRPGDRLPSVRELASQLAINPNTIQRAYRELESAGWVQTQPGKGCFVTGIPGGRQKEQLLQTLEETAQALLALGLTREDIAAHLLKGGNDHA